MLGRFFTTFSFVICSTWFLSAVVFADSNTGQPPAAVRSHFDSNLNSSYGDCLQFNAGTGPRPGDTTHDWVAAGYGNPNIEEINVYPPNDTRPYKKAISVDIVVVRNSGWTKATIQDHYRKAADIYAFCGLKFKSVRIISVDAPEQPPPPGAVDFDSGTKYLDSTNRFSERVPTGTSRLTMIHMRKLNDGDQFSMASTEARYGGTKKLNKQWLGAALASPGFARNVNKKYSPEAHEMGHVLLNCEHEQPPPGEPPVQICEGSNTPNLMNVFATKGTAELTPSQCSKIMSNKLVEGL